LGLEKISNGEEKAKTEEFISRDRIPTFWFQPEKKTVSSIINEYGGEEMRFIYKILSTSVHAGHMGMFYSEKIRMILISIPQRIKKGLNLY